MNILALAEGDRLASVQISSILINEYGYKPYLIKALSHEAVTAALQQMPGIEADFYRKNPREIIPGNKRGYTYNDIVDSNHQWLMDHFGMSYPVRLVMNRIKASGNKALILDLEYDAHAVGLRKRSVTILHPIITAVSPQKQDVLFTSREEADIKSTLANYFKQGVAA